VRGVNCVAEGGFRSEETREISGRFLRDRRMTEREKGQLAQVSSKTGPREVDLLCTRDGKEGETRGVRHCIQSGIASLIYISIRT